MKKEDLLKIDGVTPEMADSIMNMVKDGFIPKERFNEVNEARKQAENAITERDTQIAQLKDATGSTDELKKQIEQLQADNAKSVEQMNAVKLESAITLALKDAGARNIKAVLPFITAKDLLEDGTVKDLDAQIKALKDSEESNFLFNLPKTEQQPVPTGATPVNTGVSAPIEKPVEQMSYQEFVDYSSAHPEVLN